VAIAIQRLGDLGDALADQVVEAACRHDRQNRLFRLLRLLFVSEGEKALGRIEDASGGVLGGRADGGELAQSIHERRDLFRDRPAALPPSCRRASPRAAPCGKFPAP